MLHYISRESALNESPGSMAEIRDALATALSPPYRACIANAWTLKSIVVSEVLPPGSTDVPEQASNSYSLRGSITATGDQLPVPVTPLVTWYSNAAIRSGHGRSFLPSPGNASYLAASGNWDTAAAWYTTTVPAFITAARSNITVDVSGGLDATASLVVYSRTRHERALDEYYFDVVSGVLRPAPHWLRSRSTAP